MTKNIINARVTFKKSPIHVLERFSLGDSENAYKSFKDHTGLSECVILQTCNRVEIFGSGNNFDREEIKINIKAIIVKKVLFILPIMSVGLVSN